MSTEKIEITDALLSKELTPVEHKMKFRVVMMTPIWATELLKNNHPNNRKQKWHKIEQYATDMKSGFWKLTHQGVAVDLDGWLIDGQNRLLAVIDADAPAPMLLITGCARKSGSVADTGASRTVVDAARVAGKPFIKYETAYASAARYMMGGFTMAGRPMRPSHSELINFAQTHKEALDFTFEIIPKQQKGLTPAPLRAVLARAWYQRNVRTRLREFGEAICSGLVNNLRKDSSAIKLRNWLMTQSNLGGERAKIYGKCEEALRMFLAEEECDRLGSVKEEQYPLPEEK